MDFSTYDVCALTGASYRKVDYWCRAGAISPTVPSSGSGTSRRFTAADVRAVAIVERLRSQGVSLERAREVLDAIPLVGPGDAIVVNDAVEVVAADALAGRLAEIGIATVIVPDAVLPDTVLAAALVAA